MKEPEKKERSEYPDDNDVKDFLRDYNNFPEDRPPTDVEYFLVNKYGRIRGRSL